MSNIECNRDSYAHSPSVGSDTWHGLVEHLQAVASRSEEFADAFGARTHGYWLGLWHDIGKFNPKFQRYLRARERTGGPDHKRAGSQLALQHLQGAALAIQGHHGGMDAWRKFTGWLNDPDRADPDSETEARRRARQELGTLEPSVGVSLPAAAAQNALASEFFLRLLFSALVDADHLDTEAHFEPAQAERRGSEIGISALWELFEAKHGELEARSADTSVNAVRRDIYAACLAAAAGPHGFYRLSAPTGAGKTLAAMAFGLRHAIRHGLRRVIVATPFISITEQTAQAYRDAFGPLGAAVLEHHSGTHGRDPDEFDPGTERARLAAENWDAPIIVTTAVQLFESLFANTPSRCRKVHRLAGSVLILDEAQALPTHLLEPILDALRSLTTVGRASVVLSTATQPAFESIPAFSELRPRQIVSEPQRHFEALRRVTYDWRVSDSWTWDQVAGDMRSQDQALVIVNTRNDAMDLLDALDDPDALHLSTRLCGAHRLNVIERVKARLAGGRPCRLVATQVVEAGVDLDFPLVLRALGPLDSIIQAAGRCNREGQLDGHGRVVVFQPEKRRLPGGSYTTATDITLAHINAGEFDPNDPGCTAGAFFQRLLAAVDIDRAGIQELRRVFDFPAVAREFRMIDRGGEAVAITSYGTEAKQDRVIGWLDELNRGYGNPRELRRCLQPYLVTLYPYEAKRYRAQGLLPESSAAAIPAWGGSYDDVRGLVAVDGEPEEYIA